MQPINTIHFWNKKTKKKKEKKKKDDMITPRQKNNIDWCL